MEKIYFLLIFITPTLGMFRNYNKYKKINKRLFLRTPFLILVIYNLMLYRGYQDKNIFYLSLIMERWLLLFSKGLYSYYNNDYLKKKEKYKIKYGIKYELNKKN